MMLSHLSHSARFAFRSMVRANPITKKRVNWLVQHEHSSAPEIESLQRRLVARTLHSAKRNLAAYSQLDAGSDCVVRTLQNCPAVDKSNLLADPASYYPATRIGRILMSLGMTSGTTGTPLKIYRSVDSVVWEYAFIHRHWSWSGFRPGMRRATLRGDMVIGADNTSGPFWYHNRLENQLILSSRHLRPPYISKIADALEQFRPHILQAYPSTAYELSKWLEKTGRVIRIPYVYTGSEMLYPHQRASIMELFQAKVMDFYGMAERVAFAAQCEHGSYHVNPEYSYVEIVDNSGEPTAGEGNIVGTTFHNMAMPLLRYRLSDRTRWKPGTCECGRHYPMIEPIAGKFEDVVYGSSGAAISPSIVTFAFKGLQHVERSQVAQVGPSEWVIRVVPSEGFGAPERKALISNIHQLVDPDLTVSVEEVDDIPRTSAYKYRWIVNEWSQVQSRSSGL